jgi:hypothetical protein
MFIGVSCLFRISNLEFRIFFLEFVSDFDIRISGFAQ